MAGWLVTHGFTPSMHGPWYPATLWTEYVHPATGTRMRFPR